MRLHRIDLGHRGAHGAFQLLGDLVGPLERHVARQLEMQRELGPTVDLHQREIVHFAHTGHGDRCRVRALTDAGVLERLDVDDDVAARECMLDGGLDCVGGCVSLADAGHRRHADDDVRELAPARVAHAQPT